MSTDAAPPPLASAGNNNSPRRRSERFKEAVRTKHLRRLSELFWDTDERYCSTDGETKKPIGCYNNTENKSFGRLKLKQIHDSPHIYTIENFLTESELIYLESQIEAAERNGCFKASVVDAPTTTLSVVHNSKERGKKKFQEPKPGDRLAVLWEVDGDDIDDGDRNDEEYHLDTNTAKELKPWGATVLKKPTANNCGNAVFTIMKDTPGITSIDYEIFHHLNHFTVYTLEYDIYREAGYDEHTYCDVVFLSDRLLYDTTSQEILKYTTICNNVSKNTSNHVDGGKSSAPEQCLLFTDYDEDGISSDMNFPNKQISFQTPQRTSTFIHFSKSHHNKVISMERRAAELLGMPTDCIEPIQLVRYQLGDFFQAHHDLGTLYDDGTVELPPSSFLFPPRRLVTIFVYVNDVPQGCGGATKFPLLFERNTRKRASKTANTLQVHPKRGMAVLFCNIDRSGKPEPLTVHSGEPLVSLPSYSTTSKRTRTEKKSCTESAINRDSKIIKYGLNIWACER